MQALNNFKLNKIVYRCEKEERQLSTEIKRFNKGINDIGLWSNVVNDLQVTFKDLDEVHPNLLNAIYEYREDIEKEESKIAKEETSNYKLE